MASGQIKASRSESVVSYCLLAVLVAVGSVIIFLQLDYKGLDAINISSARPAVPVAQEDILNGLIPPGFKALAPISVYNADNLYEKIDGKAPFYTESGFKKLFTRWLVSQTDENLMLEFYVYDMGLFKNAFCVYSTQKRADAQMLSLFSPDFGCKSDNAVFFVHGKYYIELVGSAVSDELSLAMKDFAEEFRKGLADEKTEIPDFSILTGPNLVRGSIKLYLASALGFEGFDNTFTAVYKINGSNVTVFVSRRQNQQQAKELAEKYYKFLLDTGGEVKKLELPIDSARVINFYGPTEIVFHNDSFVAGIHEADDEGIAVKAAVLLNDILKKAGQNEPKK